MFIKYHFVLLLETWPYTKQCTYDVDEIKRCGVEGVKVAISVPYENY